MTTATRKTPAILSALTYSVETTRSSGGYSHTKIRFRYGHVTNVLAAIEAAPRDGYTAEGLAKRLEELRTLHGQGVELFPEYAGGTETSFELEFQHYGAGYCTEPRIELPSRMSEIKTALDIIDKLAREVAKADAKVRCEKAGWGTPADHLREVFGHTLADAGEVLEALKVLRLRKHTHAAPIHCERDAANFRSIPVTSTRGASLRLDRLEAENRRGVRSPDADPVAAPVESVDSEHDADLAAAAE